MTGRKRLDDRVHLVAVGGRRVGRGFALAFGTEGATAAVVARTLERCREVAAEICDVWCWATVEHRARETGRVTEAR